MVLSPFLFVLSSGDPAGWRLSLSALASILCFSCALTIFRHPIFGKLFGGGAALAGFATAYPYISTRPFVALAGAVGLIFTAFILFDFEIDTTAEETNHAERCLQRAHWATLTAPAVAVMTALFFELSENTVVVYSAVTASVIAQFLVLHWALTVKTIWHTGCSLAGIAAIVLLQPLHSGFLLVGVAAATNLANFLTMPRNQTGLLAPGGHWWEILVNHPGRILFTTFFFLCLLGSLLLIIPASTEKGAIAIIDSVFTSVSAVCVTGLIVLDTPNDFTLLGQMFILVLIQLGGLGIMSITTVALHVMGRRLSLRHEKLLVSMTDTSHQDVVRSLGTILKFTFAAEGVGATLLALAFHFAGDQPGEALWRGVFTAVSAFCNAGFALQSDSLIPYQTQPLILHTVAVLIVFGGIAPATSLVIPRWIKGKPVPIPARIALVTSAVLLAAGTFFVLAFEWNGVLAGLSFVDKVQNAWFQSVTLRTAGFNSVDIAGISSSTFLVMILFMFIGGSPGGTAGGVKTTTIAILAMTFRANIANRDHIITQHRRIHPGTVFRAVTVVVSGGAIWFLVVMMLEATQDISIRDLIFEATSALGTVGLSTGATSLLDEIGKVIVIIAMFIGRIGPISLFMLLNEEHKDTDTKYPVERVSIT